MTCFALHVVHRSQGGGGVFPSRYSWWGARDCIARRTLTHLSPCGRREIADVTDG